MVRTSSITMLSMVGLGLPYRGAKKNRCLLPAGCAQRIRRY